MNEDAVLVERAQQGDSEAFAELYERYFDRLYDFLARLVRNDAEAADLAQDTFLKAMNSLATLTKGASFKSWLFTIARNNALNRLERASRSQSLEGENDEGEQLQYDVIDTDRFGNPEEAAEAQNMAALVWEAARGLDARSYSVLHLTLREGLESTEIADVLGVTRNNAYVMVNRMKQALEDAVGALMLLRSGRRECSELEAVLSRLENAEMSPETRRAIDRHAATCDNCRDRRSRMASPFGIFAAMAPIRASEGTKEGILSNLQMSFEQMHAGGSGNEPDGGSGHEGPGSLGASSAGNQQVAPALPVVLSGMDSGLPPVTPIAASPDDEDDHRRRRKLLAGIAAVLLLLLTGTGAIALMSEGDESAEGQTSQLAAGSPTSFATSAVVAATPSPTATATEEPVVTPVNSENEPEVPLAPGGSTLPTATPQRPVTVPPTATSTSGGGIPSPVPTATPQPLPTDTPVPTATPSPIATATRTATPSATPCVATMTASPGSITYTTFGQTRTVTLSVTGCGGPISFTTSVPSGYNVIPASGSVAVGSSLALSVERLTPSAPDGMLVINPSVGPNINVTINAP